MSAEKPKPSVLHHVCFLKCKISCGVLVILAAGVKLNNKTKCFLPISYAWGGTNSTKAKASNITLPVQKYCSTLQT